MATAFSRERARTVVLALVGLLIFVFAIIPVVESILRAPRCTAGPMLNTVLATLGVFVILAARNPSAHRSLIFLLMIAMPPANDPSSVAVPLKNV